MWQAIQHLKSLQLMRLSDDQQCLQFMAISEEELSFETFDGKFKKVYILFESNFL
jgi:hypothetical protein